jgi:hypothetical protein
MYNILASATKINNLFQCRYDSLNGYSSYFNINGDVNGWDSYSNVVMYGCWAGVLFGTASDKSCYVSRSSAFGSIDASYFYTIKILMAIENNSLKERVGLTTGKIRWIRTDDTTWNSSKEVSFDIIDDGEWHVYEINMGPLQWWQGYISNLRIYPFTDGFAGDKFFIKYIKILSSDTYLCGNTQCDYYTNYSHNCNGVGVRGSIETSTQQLRYVTTSGVNDLLGLNIDNYGYEYFELGDNNLQGNSFAKVLNSKICSVGIGGYAYSSVEYSEYNKLKIISGTTGSGSSVEVLDNACSRALGFFDDEGNITYTSVNGVEPASGFDYAPSRL